MKPQRCKKSFRRPGLVAEPLEARCLLSAAPAPLLSYAPDGAAWIANPATLVRLGTGTATAYALPTASGSVPWTITSAAVFTADNSAWFLVSNGQADGVERLTPDGHFVTVLQQPGLQHLAAAGSDVWFTQAPNEIGLITTTGTRALFSIPGVAQFSQLAAVVPGAGGSDAAWFAGESTDGHGIVGSVTVDGEVQTQATTASPAVFTTNIELSIGGPSVTFVNSVMTYAVMADDSAAVISLGATSSEVIAPPSKSVPSAVPSRSPRGTAAPAATPPAAASPQARDIAGTSAKAVSTPIVFEGEFSIIASGPMPLHAEPSVPNDEEETASIAPVATNHPDPQPAAEPAQKVIAPAQAFAQQFAPSSGPLAMATVPSPHGLVPPALPTPVLPAEPLTPRVLPKWTLLAMTIFAGRQDSRSAKIQERKRRTFR